MFQASAGAAVLLQQLHEVYTKITEAELQRAKNQLKSLLMINLESKAISSEDIVRCVCGGMATPLRFSLPPP